MTAIAGSLALAAGTGPDPEWARRAVQRMAHRGPDDDGVFADTHAALSARRLAVIDPSPGGRQPLRSADGRFTMVFDGAIVNYRELAADLRTRGVKLRGTSDGEVLLAAYALDGKDALRQLRGGYAFAVWDAAERELLCARDPFGQKPLHYMVTEGGRQMRFSSERIVLTPPSKASSDIDPDALRRYLSFQYVPAPATMTPPVRALPPGHFLVSRPGTKIEVFRYWRPVLRPSRSPSVDTPEKILDALRGSVAAHLEADVPVGAFLSGGVDSAVICALAAETRPGLVTVTAGFDVDGYNEIPWARETASALGLRNVSCVITPKEFIKRLPEIVWHLGDPIADAAAVPLWFAAREARKHVGVVLSGEGADELFGGYRVYHQHAAVRAASALPGVARTSAGVIAARMAAGQRGKGLLQRVATPLRDRYIGNANVFSLHDVDALTRYGDGTVYDVTDPLFDQAEDAELDDVATMQLVDINTWLPGDILAKADRMSMAHGLQLRSPFLDREVMAVASRLARAEKIAAGTTKFALREAAGTLVPREAAERPKLGFPVPLGHWFRGELAGYPEHVLRGARTEEWLDKRAVVDVARRFRQGDPDVSWRQIWSLVVFSLWHQIFVEGMYDPVKLGWIGGSSASRALPPAGARPGSVAGGRPGSVPGARPGSVAGDRPGSVPGGRPGSVAGGRPGSVAGGRPGSVPGGARPSAAPGLARPDSVAGGRPDSVPGGARPSAASGLGRPGSVVGEPRHAPPPPPPPDDPDDPRPTFRPRD